MTHIAAFLVLLLLAPSASLACRTAYRDHDARLEVATVAFVATVVGTDERQKDADGATSQLEKLREIARARRVALSPTSVLKGGAAVPTSVVVDHCDGSVYAVEGRVVNVYQIHGEWVIAPLDQH